MTETNDSNKSSFPRSRVKKQSNKVLYLFIITILALTGGFFFYQKNVISTQQDYPGDNTSTKSQRGGIDTSSSGSSLDKNKAISTDEKDIATAKSAPIANRATPPAATTLPEQPESSSDSPQKTSSDVASPLDEEVDNDGWEAQPSIDSEKSLTELNNFYTHLDSEAYMQAFQLPEPSKDHFSKLIQKLIDNPPVVTRETDNLFTLLKNTAHFFRIIGKDNILVLKGILDREKDSVEVVLKALYQLTAQPQLLKNEYSIDLDNAALYDYAVFFLNTMGGRLYLFRRDSNSRMAVSFYAIKIIDRANDSGDSRHGIDIRPAINSLLEEMENGGNNLKKRDYYLDTLYDLKEKYD